MNWPLPPVLVVDDEKNMRLSLKSILSGEGYELRLVESAEEALASMEKEEFLMVITDARLGGGMSGYQFLGLACKKWPNTPFLMITAYATPKLAVEAIKAGAIDYLAKPFAPEELLHAVSRCAELHRLKRDNAALRASVAEPFQIDQIIGESAKMQELRQLIRSVAPTDATVLILGESGTGKELIAGALHSLSQRRQNNYIRINCAAIPENLLESELFGHEKGSFTGAVKQKLGRVEEAHGGTIFLDEIGDMSRPLQAKLLRFLEDGSFTRVGGNDELHVDVRLIAATNRDIIEAIGQNNFREDLFHRLNVVQFRPAALAGAGQRHHRAGGEFFAAFQRDDEQARPGRLGAGAAEAAFLSLAGERARIAQRHRTGHHPGNLAGDSTGQPAGFPVGRALAQIGRHRHFRQPIAGRADGGFRAAGDHQHAGTEPLQHFQDGRAAQAQPARLALPHAAVEHHRLGGRPAVRRGQGGLGWPARRE